ncbi:MAG TPA: mechanosensitive ion channel family protein [Bacteroidia bacterium]|nr:mechanosensitive ion channel family protein [Bacteroidia bacterium]
MSFDITELLNHKLLGNTVQAYLICVAILLLGYIFRNIFTRYSNKLFFRLFKKFSKNKFADEFVVILRGPVKLFFELIILFIAVSPLVLPPGWNINLYKNNDVNFILSAIYEGAIIISITWILLRMADFMSLVLMERAQQTADMSDDQLVTFFKELAKFIIIVLGFFVLLGVVFKVNIMALITGLGIGGLAIALAAQETLSNLLGSFIIFLDKPFKAGDFVNVSDITGTVEKVGFRSTRIRTPDKSLLTVPNKKMIDSPLNNISLSSFRRVKFTIGLTYDTTAAQLKTITSQIRAFLEEHMLIDEDITVLFTDFGDSDLKISVIFFVRTSSWDVMVKTKEEVNYKVMEIVEANGSSFAFPTQTVYNVGEKS